MPKVIQAESGQGTDVKIEWKRELVRTIFKLLGTVGCLGT